MFRVTLEEDAMRRTRLECRRLKGEEERFIEVTDLDANGYYSLTVRHPEDHKRPIVSLFLSPDAIDGLRDFLKGEVTDRRPIIEPNPRRD